MDSVVDTVYVTAHEVRRVQAVRGGGHEMLHGSAIAATVWEEVATVDLVQAMDVIVAARKSAPATSKAASWERYENATVRENRLRDEA